MTQAGKSVRAVRRFMVVALVGAAIVAGCGDDNTGSEAPLVGQRVGTYGGGESSTGSDFTLIVSGDGELGIGNGLPGPDVDATGTYTLGGTTFTATCTCNGGGVSYDLDGDADRTV